MNQKSLVTTKKEVFNYLQFRFVILKRPKKNLKVVS